MEIENQPTYFVVQCLLKYASFEEVKAKASHEVAAHVKRSKELHDKRVLLMAGAFLDKADGSLSTMAIVASRQDAEAYVHGDPFYLNGMMSEWSIYEWANMFA